MIRESHILVRITLFLSFFFIGFSVFSQAESIVYIGINGKLTTLDQAIFMQKIITKSPKLITVQTYKLNDSNWEKLYSEQYKKLNDSTFQVRGNGEKTKGTTFRTFIRQAEDLWKFRDVVNDQIVRSGFATSVAPLFVHGQLTEFYTNGKIRSVSQYNHNELVSNQNWDENGEKYFDNIFYSVDTDPTFKPGMTVMHSHILKGFKDAGIDISAISGSMAIGFVVLENGTIDGIKIIKGLGPTINNVALESISTLNLLGSWTPAQLNNQTVRFFQVFPINFIYKEAQLDFAELRGSILHFQTK